MLYEISAHSNSYLQPFSLNFQFSVFIATNLQMYLHFFLMYMPFDIFRLRPRPSVKFIPRLKKILDYDLEQHQSLEMAAIHQEAPFRLVVFQ
jgi:hypothetical protein